MGCDIHAMVEVTEKIGTSWTFWKNAGNPDIRRNYDLFAVLGNVRNYYNIPFISDNRFKISDFADLDIKASSEFEAWVQRWEDDGHSHSYVTLAEMEAFDTNQEYESQDLVCSRDENGDILKVGKVKIFETFKGGTQYWLDLINRIKAMAKVHGVDNPEHIRLVFFFDN